MLTDLPDFIAEARTFVEEHGIRIKERAGVELRIRIFTRPGAKGYFYETSHHVHVPKTGKYTPSNCGPYATLDEARQKAISETFAFKGEHPTAVIRLEPNEDY